MDPPPYLLRALAQRMERQGVRGDVRRIATVILETARDLQWAEESERVADWLTQLAIELAQTSPARGLRFSG